MCAPSKVVVIVIGLLFSDFVQAQEVKLTAKFSSLKSSKCSVTVYSLGKIATQIPNVKRKCKITINYAKNTSLYSNRRVLEAKH